MDMALPAPDARMILDEATEFLRERDPAGQAGVVFDLGTGRRSGVVVLWGQVELQFWVEHRAIRGDVMFMKLCGQLPHQMSDKASPRRIWAVNVPEFVIAILAETATRLFEKAIYDSLNSDQTEPEDAEDARALIVLFHRARNICTQLIRIAAEKHEGSYKMLAFNYAVVLGSNQRLAELALNIDTDDLAED